MHIFQELFQHLGQMEKLRDAISAPRAELARVCPFRRVGDELVEITGGSFAAILSRAGSL
jgi:hypothetical protein